MVSVLCLCYNHQDFIKKALESVYYQDFEEIEILIIDDFSSDKSVEIIEKFLKEIPLYHQTLPKHFKRTVFFEKNTQNLGNCKSFNILLGKTTGKYIIDFATDDVLLDNRVSSQVKIFENLGEEYGVIFSNAMLINEKGQFLKPHFPIENFSKNDFPSNNFTDIFSQKTTQKIPFGDIYKHILEKYFVCTPTMMMRKSLLVSLGGYDENLSYEDFDFWVRSSRNFLYFYQDNITTLKRILKKSHSTAFYTQKKNPHLQSTLEVCKKAFLLNKTEEEHYFLAKNIQYHQRQALFMEDFDLVFGYQNLLEKINSLEKIYTKKWVLFCAKFKIRLHFFYKMYLRLIK